MPIGAARAGVVSGRGDAIPDSGMFQSPIYHWLSMEGIGVSDGQTASTWEDKLSTITASAVGAPTYRSSFNGKAAVEYDGIGDGHDFTPDAQMPTGNDSFSIATTVYTRDIGNRGVVVSWGTDSGGEAVSLTFNNNNLTAQSWTDGLQANTTPPTDQWITCGWTYDGAGSHTIYLNGSSDGTNSFSMNTPDSNHSLGYRRFSNSGYLDGGVFDVVISDAEESEQAFSDYHQERLG